MEAYSLSTETQPKKTTAELREDAERRLLESIIENSGTGCIPQDALMIAAGAYKAFKEGKSYG